MGLEEKMQHAGGMLQPTSSKTGGLQYRNESHLLHPKMLELELERTAPDCVGKKSGPRPEAGSPQHHIQQHHDRKAQNDTHSGKIGLGILISLTFRDQLMYCNQDHGTCRKGEGIRKHRFHIHHQ